MSAAVIARTREHLVSKAATISLVSAVLVFAVFIAGCGADKRSGGSVLYTTPTTPWWLSAHSHDPVGRTLAAGQIPLCTRGSKPVTLTSIVPVKVSGQIKLDGVRVRRTTAPNTVTAVPGVPPGSRPVAGFIVHASSPCKWPNLSDPYYEVLVFAHRTGPGVGWIKGLRVSYTSDGSEGTLMIPYGLALCNKGTTKKGLCST